MNNFEKHEKAQQLADSTSAYELARRVVDMESARGETLAWLVTGGRLFKDRAFISERWANESARARNDGSEVKPLCAATDSED